MKLERRAPLLLPLLLTAACSGGGTTQDDDGPDPSECPAQLPTAAITCTDPSCNVATGTKTVGTAELSADVATNWLVITHVSSDLFENDNVTLSYVKGTAGALTAAERRQRAPRIDDAEARRLRARVAAERRIRENGAGAIPARGEFVSGVRGKDLLPPGALKQDTACATAAPYCTGNAICVPDGAMRVCKSALTLKWRDQTSPANFDVVDATVRKVGNHAAIVVDDADAVSDADVDELLKRFDEHIAPIDHQFFGEPRDANGDDFDKNGVTILFLTSKITEVDAQIVGFFQATDLEDPAVNPASNGADLLYLQPPGGNIDLDSLSGTIAHEYEHLISYYAKVVNRGSSPEAAWLDEGLAAFAEDINGYGGDAFLSVSKYLEAVGDTSLTGFGLIATNPSEADSVERRGMAHLFLRFMYEQRGGATFGDGPAAVTDDGGVAAIRNLVQAPDTGVELITQSKTGRSLDSWLSGFLVAVAIDGAGYENVSCNERASFAAPKTDAYTGFQRGLDLRTSITAPNGTLITLNGPTTPTFATEEPPIPSNGGEIRTVSVPSGSTTVTVGGPAEDYVVGFTVIPAVR